jgi:chorismate dehydratase
LKPRIAASSYLNSAPLIWSFTEGPRQNEIDITHPVPSRCAELLTLGEVEGALVPVIEYQRIPDIKVVPGVCVASQQRVRSVVLASRKDDLREVGKVALDESSRTSASLTKIIFQEFLGTRPEWQSAAPDLERMLQENDAALIIGDPGMTFSREGLYVYDLATLWRNHTGFGFVFAMWMARSEDADRIRQIDFASVRDEGLANIEQIVSAYEKRLPLSRDELTNYLTENITFFMDETIAKGLQLYFELAHKHGLVPVNKPIDYIS